MTHSYYFIEINKELDRAIRLRGKWGRDQGSLCLILPFCLFMAAGGSTDQECKYQQGLLREI
jgi:hypothetical protein